MLEKLTRFLHVTTRTTKILATLAICVFILVYIALLTIFIRNGITPLIYVDIASIVFYFVALALLHLEYWRTFALTVFAQVYAHTAFAVYLLGWDPGFQVTILVLIVLGFYSEYAARSMRVKTLHAMTFAIIGTVLYLGLLILCKYHEAPYSLPENDVFFLQLLWAVLEFVIIIAYLQVFLTIAWHSEKTLSDEATHDRLTGMSNRYYMSKRLGEIAEGEGLEGCWVAIADLDDFKHVNDTYGHNCGDFVLQTFAQIISEIMQDCETCRWGGEEFLVVGRADGSASCREKLERLRLAMKEHNFWYEENRLNLTITIGAANYVPGLNLTEWVNAADKKLYEGKRSGKNQVVV